MDPKNLAYQRVSDVGAPWIQGYHSTTIYFHVNTPNTRSCMFPPGRIATSANSGHQDGVFVCMFDGSVRWVHEKGQGVYEDDGKLRWLDGVHLRELAVPELARRVQVYLDSTDPAAAQHLDGSGRLEDAVAISREIIEIICVI